VGVAPQAIEQPLGMSLPENKMMTGLEIENDRRVLNTLFSVQRARKERVGWS